jgi:glycyl-tRNA synthetase beta chain
MSTRNLLVELFVEELPPKVLRKLGEAFAKGIFFELRKNDFLEADSFQTSFASPRRLAVHITNVRSVCPDIQDRKRLLPVEVAYDSSGHPTAALLKRLEKESAQLSDTSRAFEDAKEFIWLDRIVPGHPLEYIIEAFILASLSNLPIPKVMGYQINDGWETVNFVRPAHGLVVLYGDKVLSANILGLTSGNTTQGHRFEAKKTVVTLRSADSYAQQLEDEGAVIASFDARRAEIVRQLQAAATAQNLKPIEDDALLDEVTALVERPNVLLGQFEEEFLAVPQECLILTMKSNQKYFPLLDANGKLTNKFLIVSNINPADASKVIGGNERVVRPRLADAKFFFDQDRKKTLDSRLPGLAKVVYHNKLGSQGERNERVVAIASAIAQQIGGDGFVAKVAQAARLSKVDLLTDMVGEFPELQGIMGRYYAQHEGLADDVAYAIEDHYRPRFAGDDLPRSQVGVVVALADKLETLVGLFSIGEKPTGDKDPFALRRQALGVVRLIFECDLDIKLKDILLTVLKIQDELIIQSALKKNLLPDPIIRDEKLLINTIYDFIIDRLSGNLREQGASAQEVDAVLSLSPNQLAEIPRRLAAVQAFAKLPEAPALAAANKRVSNILKKAESDSLINDEVDDGLLQDDAELSLYGAIRLLGDLTDQLYNEGAYKESLIRLAGFKEVVDSFFDNVMVNSNNISVKNNRLALLKQLHSKFNRVADLSKLAS